MAPPTSSSMLGGSVCFSPAREKLTMNPRAGIRFWSKLTPGSVSCLEPSQQLARLVSSSWLDRRKYQLKTHGIAEADEGVFLRSKNERNEHAGTRSCGLIGQGYLR